MFRSDESGTVLVEYAVVAPTFMLCFFAVLDFGRLGAERVLGQKAAERSVRIASVRDPVCELPARLYSPILADPAPIEGPEGSTSDSRVCLPCAEIGGCSQWVRSCTLQDGLDAGSQTAAEIWQRNGPLFPSDVEPADVRVIYATNPALGRAYDGRFDGLVSVEVSTDGQSVALPGITAPAVLHSTVLAGDLRSDSRPPAGAWCAGVPFLAR